MSVVFIVIWFGDVRNTYLPHLKS